MQRPYLKLEDKVRIVVPDFPRPGNLWQGQLACDWSNGFRGEIVARDLPMEDFVESINSGKSRKFPSFLPCLIDGSVTSTLVYPFVLGETWQNFSHHILRVKAPILLRGIALSDGEQKIFTGFSMHSDGIFTWFNHKSFDIDLAFKPMRANVTSNPGPEYVGSCDRFEKIVFSPYTSSGMDTRNYEATVVSLVRLSIRYREAMSLRQVVQDIRALQMLFSLLNSDFLGPPGVSLIADTRYLDIEADIAQLHGSEIYPDLFISDREYKKMEIPLAHERLFVRQFCGDKIFPAMGKFCELYNENPHAFRLYQVAKNESVPFEETFLCLIRAIESLIGILSPREQLASPQIAEITNIVQAHASDDAKEFYDQRIRNIPFGARSLSKVLDEILAPLKSFPIFSSAQSSKIAKMRGRLTHSVQLEPSLFYQNLFLSQQACLIAFEFFLLVYLGFEAAPLIDALTKSDKYSHFLRQEFPSDERNISS